MRHRLQADFPGITRPTASPGATAGVIEPCPRALSFVRCDLSTGEDHLPLLSEFGAVEVGEPGELGVDVLTDDEVDDGDVPADEELVSDDVVPVDGVLDDGLLDEESLDVDGGVLGDMVELDDVELDGVDGVAVVDEDDEVDGDGVTTGGVVVDVVDGSRLQPATPSTMLVQSKVTNARFIRFSK
jgi:hypothetical protein